MIKYAVPVFVFFRFGCAGADLKIGETVYRDYEVAKVEPDGLRIIHSGGSLMIPYEQLPAELRKQYFDTAKMDKLVAAKAAAAKKAKEAAPKTNPQAWENIAADPANAMQGRVWSLAEVQTKMPELDGKIICVEVKVDAASKVEAIDKGSLRVFGGTNLKKDSNYEFIAFPAEAEKKMRGLLKSSTGSMAFWVRVEAENQWPYPQLLVVGRSINQGGFQW
ncbi:MAG TPA: hypothetical protein VG796_01310 [Verrucomicrobiales bacterium]|nr:hypothetical protein [Verrucomicrobiales bacterium]